MEIDNLAHIPTEDLIAALEKRSVAALGLFFVVGNDGETVQYEAVAGDVCLRIGMSKWLEATVDTEAFESFPGIDDEEDD